MRVYFWFRFLVSISPCRQMAARFYFVYIKASFLHTKSITCTMNVFFCVSREIFT